MALELQEQIRPQRRVYILSEEVESEGTSFGDPGLEKKLVLFPGVSPHLV